MPATPTLSRDTIVAIATPPGRGGIGILRLSGPNALAVAAPLLHLRAPLEPNRARFCEIIDPGTDPATAAIEPSSAATSPAGPATGTKLDQAVVTFYRAPHSYTGEDVLEIAAHGSPVLLDFLLRRLTAQGARLADPGEFTQRAFLAGRLDLTQAEAVRDLIDAQTLYQARIAAQQLDGALSRRVAPIKQALIHLIVQLEAGIDFAEDDTPTLSPDALLALAAPIEQALLTLAHSFAHGRLVHAGLTLALIGQPNVGKSSLFNCLVERERAIVTANPGTTRDLVTERVSIGGIPIELVDTAGLRTAAPSGPLDEAERLGIEKSREALAEADLILLVLDAAALFASLNPADHPQTSQAALTLPGAPTPTSPPFNAPDATPLPSTESSAAVLNLTGSGAASRPLAEAEPAPLPLAAAQAASLPLPYSKEAIPASPADRTALLPLELLRSLAGRRVLILLNKCDLLPDPIPAELAMGEADMPQPLAHRKNILPQSLAHIRNSLPGATLIATSAHTGVGIGTLRQAIARQLQAPSANDEGGMLTNLRQHQSVQGCLGAIQAAAAAAQLPHEMPLLDLYTALRHLDTLTGETTPDDILNLIFSTFCIGK